MSMITVLDKPLSASHVKDGLPRMIIGFMWAQSGFALTVEGDGRLEWQDIDQLIVDWRWDSRSKTWRDIGGPDGTDE